jgi:hypothetical protein
LDRPGHAAKVELRRHDVTSDEIATSAYDLIHARLVLVHLPERDQVIERLVGALRPGGWLVLEEFDQIFPACPEPTTDEQRTFNRVRDAFGELLARRGGDTTTYPRTLPWRMQRAGLSQTGAEGRLVFGTGASPGAAVQRANLLQIGDQAVDARLITASELATVLRLLDDQGFTFAMPLLIPMGTARSRSLTIRGGRTVKRAVAASVVPRRAPGRGIPT